jgi:hypothetical protein
MDAIAQNALYVKVGDNIYDRIKHTVTDAKALYEFTVPMVNTELLAVNIETVFPVIGVIGKISQTCRHSNKFKIILSGGLLTEAFSKELTGDDILDNAHDVDLFITIKNYVFLNRKLMVTALEEYLTDITEQMKLQTNEFTMNSVCFSAYALTLALTLKGQHQETQIQFIKKIYNKSYNIIEGFDIAPCKILWDFDAKNYTVHGDAAYALANRRIKFDKLKYSGSYEHRLCKYYMREFGLEITDEQYYRLEGKLQKQLLGSNDIYSRVQFNLGGIKVSAKLTKCQCTETCNCNAGLTAALSTYSKSYNNYGTKKFDDRYIIWSIVKGFEIRGFTLAMINVNTQNVFNSTFIKDNYGEICIRGSVFSNLMHIQNMQYRQLIGVLSKYSEHVSVKEFMLELVEKADTADRFNMTETINKIADMVVAKTNVTPTKVFDNHTFYIEGEPGYTSQFGALEITDSEWFKELDNLSE